MDLYRSSLCGLVSSHIWSPFSLVTHWTHLVVGTVSCQNGFLSYFNLMYKESIHAVNKVSHGNCNLLAMWFTKTSRKLRNCAHIPGGSFDAFAHPLIGVLKDVFKCKAE